MAKVTNTIVTEIKDIPNDATYHINTGGVMGEVSSMAAYDTTKPLNFKVNNNVSTSYSTVTEVPNFFMIPVKFSGGNYVNAESTIKITTDAGKVYNYYGWLPEMDDGAIIYIEFTKVSISAVTDSCSFHVMHLSGGTGTGYGDFGGGVTPSAGEILIGDDRGVIPRYVISKHIIIKYTTKINSFKASDASSTVIKLSDVLEVPVMANYYRPVCIFDIRSQNKYVQTRRIYMTCDDTKPGECTINWTLYNPTSTSPSSWSDPTVSCRILWEAIY